MIGHIESYDDERQTGAIKCEDEFYEFHIDEWNAETEPKIGDDVDFMPEEDGSATNVGLVGKYLKNMQAVKNHYIAGALGILFGFAGIHRIYLGFYTIAIAQILLTYFTAGYGVMWGLIDGVLLLTGHIKKDAKGRPLK
jgi:TM2 domain-containing membrane protein YozV